MTYVVKLPHQARVPAEGPCIFTCRTRHQYDIRIGYHWIDGGKGEKCTHWGWQGRSPGRSATGRLPL